MKQVSISIHARQRIAERCAMTEDEVKGLLDAGVAVPVECHTPEKSAYRLFYSYRDEHWFIAVQDPQQRCVLTVMPLTFLSAQRFTVTSSQRNEARRKALQLREARLQQYFAA